MNNDIYYQSSPKINTNERITTDGSSNIFNGVTDWLYQEEIFLTSQALWWSKNGEQLAFLTIDNQKVRHANIPIYEKQQYSSHASQAYPKVDVSILPTVNLKIYNKFEKIQKKLNILADSS